VTEDHDQGSPRRDFLYTVIALASILPIAPVLVERLGDASAASSPASTELASIHGRAYKFLNERQAAFTEKMVNALCPADALTPDGMTCGLATWFDRNLEDETVRQLFTGGVTAVNRASLAETGHRFDQLSDEDANAFLLRITSGEVAHFDMPLPSWLRDVVYPVLLRACFAGPVHDGYSNKVFWKLFGYVGEPVAYRENSCKQRWKPLDRRTEAPETVETYPQT
jgi:gluconate 2-dehydrogenase gamma chain